METGRIEYHSIESNALYGNRLNDPYQREVAVYLPPDYDSSDRQYPTLYLLSSHGRTSYYYLGWNQWDEPIQDRLNRLILSGQMPSVIVVLPDCWTRLGGSQFLDSAMGNYATYLTKEIVPFVDQHFRTLPAYRGICGHSSGGYGAIFHAMKNPHLFNAVGCRAADMYWEYTALPALARLHQYLAKWEGFEKFIAEIPTLKPKGGSFWEAIHAVMLCIAYGTNSDALLGFDSVIDMETGALIPEIWERWLQFDPVRMIDQAAYQAALRQMKVVFVEVGSYDEYQLQVGARIFHQKLTKFGIPHLYEEFPDGHGSTSYRYDVMLPILAKALQ